MSESQRRDIELLGQSIEYEVTKSSDASKPRLDVDIHGVTVVIPTSETANPGDLLRENAAWLVEKVNKYQQHRERAPERQFEEGETFPYLGEQHEVIIESRPSSSAADGTLRLAKHHVEETSTRRGLETLYRREARKRFERRANHFADEMGVEYDQIEIRNQRTKWGSCSTSGTLGLNWRLMMASPEVIDYIVVHELAHLREANHTQAFWDFVAEYDPNYVEHAEWLEQNSTQLIFSKDDL